MVPIRRSADVRKASILRAAIVEFARSGYAGTSTESIAARAGISQPYIFRLFGTKKDLFCATYDAVTAAIEDAFVAAAQGLEGEDAMAAMELAYLELLQDPDLLQVQLHGFVAAAADPDIAQACQETFRRLSMLVNRYADVTPETMRDFFAHGMLCSVISASLVLGSVPAALEGVASGTNSAFRELGGVLGIAVLGAVFSPSGGYSPRHAFVCRGSCRLSRWGRPRCSSAC
jgi:AcrR family transcriptional regulator